MIQNSRQVFRTHSNYLNAIRHIASSGIEDDAQKALELLALKVYDSGCLNLQREIDFDKDDIHHSLNNAWGIEALLKTENILINEDDLIRLSNNWCIVQTYYVVFYSTQAIAITEGYSKPITHPQTHRTYHQIWSKKPCILAPWAITYDENGFKNLPDKQSVDDHIHSWTKVEEQTALSLYCKALRTTREEFIEEALSKRRERLAIKKDMKNVKFSEEDKHKTISRIRPTSLINYLFRLKRRTNYEQSSALALGPQNEHQSKELRENLSFIIESTLLVTEFIICRSVGDETYYNWCREWEKYKAPAFDNIGPEKRFEIIF